MFNGPSLSRRRALQALPALAAAGSPLGLMAAIGLGLGLFFWRKRYLGTSR